MIPIRRNMQKTISSTSGIKKQKSWIQIKAEAVNGRKQSVPPQQQTPSSNQQQTSGVMNSQNFKFNKEGAP